MARSRNIKPGFFQNEILAELSFETRLLFIGLWCLADCEGRLEYRPKRIKASLFPYDDVNIERMVTELVTIKENFLTVYVVDGNQYIQVNNFKKHQNPHKKECEAGSQFPPCPGISGARPDPDPVQIGTSPADSLNLIPDSLINGDDKSSVNVEKAKLTKIDQENQVVGAGKKRAEKNRFSEDSTQIVKAFRAMLEQAGITTFRKDWHLTSYSACESLIRQGRPAGEIEAVMSWAVHDWACKTSVTHFKHVVSAYPHWERQSEKGGKTREISPEIDTSKRDALLAFPFIQAGGDLIPTVDMTIDSGHPNTLFYKGDSFHVDLLNGVSEAG